MRAKSSPARWFTATYTPTAGNPFEFPTPDLLTAQALVYDLIKSKKTAKRGVLMVHFDATTYSETFGPFTAYFAAKYKAMRPLFND